MKPPSAKTPTIECPTCGGHGRRLMSQPCARVLGILAHQWQDTGLIRRILRHDHRDLVTASALVNRLMRLGREGFATRRKTTRGYEWRLA